MRSSFGSGVTGRLGSCPIGVVAEGLSTRASAGPAVVVERASAVSFASNRRSEIFGMTPLWNLDMGSVPVNPVLPGSTDMRFPSTVQGAMRWLVPVISFVVVALQATVTGAAPTVVRCDSIATADFAIDGLLDDWPRPVLARAGVPSDGAVELRCAWDGTALAVALDVKDDRIVRVRGKGHEDRLAISVSAGKAAVAIAVSPGNAIARAKITSPAKVSVADSLQPKGFSVELRIPVAQLAGFSPSTPSLELRIVFTDADQATGGDTTTVPLDASLELGDRKDLLDDFLRTVKLKKSDLRLDTLAELEPRRTGAERIVAGGTVIGVLTDRFAFVAMPVAKPADVREVKLVPLGVNGHMIIAAVIRQFGNGGSRDLLMLWTVWSGQLEPLAQIEIRKEMGANVLDTSWKVVPGPRKLPELVVEPKPAVGFTADTWNEEPAGDAHAIVVPWDPAKSGVGYTLTGAELTRRDLPKKRR